MSTHLCMMIGASTGEVIKRTGNAIEGIGCFDDDGLEYAGGFDSSGVAVGSVVDTDDTILTLEGERTEFIVGRVYEDISHP